MNEKKKISEHEEFDRMLYNYYVLSLMYSLRSVMLLKDSLVRNLNFNTSLNKEMPGKNVLVKMF